MADTGAPWNLPYPLPTDLVRDGAQAIQDLAEATAAGLDAAGPDGFVFAGTRYYTSSGDFDKNDPFNDESVGTPKAIRVRAVGGGGGGGNTAAAEGGAGGGGGGGTGESFITDIAGLDTVTTVTVGSGGSATNAGGASSFASLVVGSGGGAGGDFAGAGFGGGTAGAGGSATGQLVSVGGPGGVGSARIIGSGVRENIAGNGGNSTLGGGAAGRPNINGSNNGLSATGIGGGGGGANSADITRTGGDGADGIVIIDVFV